MVEAEKETRKRTFVRYSVEASIRCPADGVPENLLVLELYMCGEAFRDIRTYWHLQVFAAEQEGAAVLFQAAQHKSAAVLHKGHRRCAVRKYRPDTHSLPPSVVLVDTVAASGDLP